MDNNNNSNNNNNNNYYGNICYCRKCNGIVHTIKKGDSLYLLSRYYNVPIGEIMNANRNLNVYNLQIGEEICIPIRRQDMMNDTFNNIPDMDDAVDYSDIESTSVAEDEISPDIKLSELLSRDDMTLSKLKELLSK